MRELEKKNLKRERKTETLSQWKIEKRIDFIRCSELPKKCQIIFKTHRHLENSHPRIGGPLQFF